MGVLPLIAQLAPQAGALQRHDPRCGGHVSLEGRVIMKHLDRCMMQRYDGMLPGDGPS